MQGLRTLRDSSPLLPALHHPPASTASPAASEAPSRESLHPLRPPSPCEWHSSPTCHSVPREVLWIDLPRDDLTGHQILSTRAWEPRSQVSQCNPHWIPKDTKCHQWTTAGAACGGIWGRIFNTHTPGHLGQFVAGRTLRHPFQNWLLVSSQHRHPFPDAPAAAL